MPRISAFHGLVVVIYFQDHPPPHFHVRCAGDAAVFSLHGDLLHGYVLVRARQRVRTWAQLHRDELKLCWKRAARGWETGTIEPLR